MKELMTAVSEWLNQGENVVLATIIASTGSTPRGTGARMAMISDGSFVGTIGGGAVEYKVQEMAAEAFKDRISQIKSFNLSNGEKEDLGMVCGGSVTVYLQYIQANEGNARDLFSFGSGLFSQNVDSWLVTDITDETDCHMYIHVLGSNNVDLPDYSQELFANRAAQVEISGKTYYSEPLTRAGRVYVFGGGHVSRELIPLLSHLGFSCFVFDCLPEFADKKLFPAADGVILGGFNNISAYVDITEKDYVVIMTRGHSSDYTVQAQALRLKPYYIGVIGSRAKIDAVSKKLREQGFSREEIDSVHTPIGIDIKADTPAEVAVSIAAELIMARAEAVNLILKKVDNKLKNSTISIEEAVGLPLSHDLTIIDPERNYKGAKYKRGYILHKDDLPVLRRMGRLHLSVLELEPEEIHEDFAAMRLAKRFKSSSFLITLPSEGRCNLKAEKDGLFILDEHMVNRINSDNDWVLSTIANYSTVKKGETVAAWRIGPLAMNESRVAIAEKAIEESMVKFKIAEFKPLKTAHITIGSEILSGEIRDAFHSKLLHKLEKYGAPIIFRTTVTDDKNDIIEAIKKGCERGAEAIFCTGGMSIDADDMTPGAIYEVSDEVLFRGVPVLPGSNLMLGRKKWSANSGEVYIFGVPACAVHSDTTSLDTVMSRVYAGVPPTEKDTRTWGVGGLCRMCEKCAFPICSYGSR